MHELARIDSTNIPGTASHLAARGLACTAVEIKQVLRLRYEVFTEDMGVVFPDAYDGIEQDRFDSWCEHLMVQELDTGRVVGTYLILTPARARQAGGYYSQSEFDLSGLGEIADEIVEVGRSCVPIPTTVTALSLYCCGQV
jgi:putative hemolysin